MAHFAVNRITRNPFPFYPPLHRGAPAYGDPYPAPRYSTTISEFQLTPSGELRPSHPGSTNPTLCFTQSIEIHLHSFRRRIVKKRGRGNMILEFSLLLRSGSERCSKVERAENAEAGIHAGGSVREGRGWNFNKTLIRRLVVGGGGGAQLRGTEGRTSGVKREGSRGSFESMLRPTLVRRVPEKLCQKVGLFKAFAALFSPSVSPSSYRRTLVKINFATSLIPSYPLREELVRAISTGGKKLKE